MKEGPGKGRRADLKIIIGRISVQNYQMANHFAKWLALLADHQRNIM